LAPSAEPRHYPFVDNLRSTMIVLVLSMHAADTYSTLGNWYYQERTQVALPTLVGFWTYQAFLQAFFMGLLFFFAGYFVPAAYDRKGASRFLRDRFKRLGLPTLLYMFVVGPLTEYYISRSWRPNPRISFVHEWTIYIVRIRFPGGTGPMWFCEALLIFCGAYALLRSVARAIAPARSASPVAPTHLEVFAFVLIMATATFLVRFVQPASTSFYNMHLADFSQYVLLFAAGIVAYRRQWLKEVPYAFGIQWLLIGLAGGAVLWFVLIAYGGALHGDTSAYGGGLYWQSAVMNLWESLVCAGMLLGLTVIFRRYFNTQGRVARFLSDNAFAVYLFHPPILIAIALGLHSLELPIVAKTIVLTALAGVASFGLSAMVFRRIPILRQIL
jgi:glucan biosynthesis protein C